MPKKTSEMEQTKKRSIPQAEGTTCSGLMLCCIAWVFVRLFLYMGKIYFDFEVSLR